MPQASRRVASGAAADIGPGRKAAHAAAGLAGWLGFAALWVWQLEVFVPANWLGGLKVIGLLVVVSAVVTVAWVRWNRNIYRRRHRRFTAMFREVQFERDSLGRAVEASPAVLLAPPEIRVALSPDGRVKRYLVTQPRSSAPSAPAPAGEEVRSA